MVSYFTLKCDADTHEKFKETITKLKEMEPDIPFELSFNCAEADRSALQSALLQAL